MSTSWSSTRRSHGRWCRSPCTTSRARSGASGGAPGGRLSLPALQEDTMTRCLLVSPRFSEFSYWNYREVCELFGARYPAAPLGLVTVAALLPQEWTIRLLDLNVREMNTALLDWADIVMTGGMIPQQRNLLSPIELL